MYATHPDLARLDAAEPSPVARALAVVADPALVVLGTYAATGLRSENPRKALGWSAVAVLLVAGVPYAIVAQLVRTGHLHDMHVVVREQRLMPLAISTTSAAVAMGALKAGGAPRHVSVLTTSLLAGVAVMAGISTRHKTSFHVAASTWSSAVLAAQFGTPTAAVTGPAAVAVAWSRHRGGRHSLGQVLSGGVIGGLLGAGTVWALRRPTRTVTGL